MESIDYLITFSLSVLAVYRVSYMLVNEDGPVDVFSKLREWVGQGTWIGRGFHCILCVSVWFSAIPALFMPHIFILDWLAISGAVLIIVKRLNQQR